MSKNSELYVAIPIETSVRELHPKLRLASFFLKENFNVIIGSYDEVYHLATNNKLSVLFVNNLDLCKVNEDLFLKTNSNETKILLLENEGLICADLNILVNRIHKPFIKHIYKYLAWGNEMSEMMIEKKYFKKDQIIISGHPIFEESKKKYYIERDIEFKHKNYILINTNFSGVNEAVAGQYVKFMDKESIEYTSNMQKSFISLTKHLSKYYTNTKIVLRPHPSESHFIYNKEFKQLENVYVIHKGRAIDWIHNAKCLIHNNCTTAIEAALHEIPVLTYKPFEDPKFDIEIANSAGLICSNENEICNHINDNFKKYQKPNIIRLANFNLNFYQNLKKNIKKFNLKHFVKHIQPGSVFFIFKKYIQLFFPLFLLSNSRKQDFKYRRRKFSFLKKDDLYNKFLEIHPVNKSQIKRISFMPRTFIIKNNR